jgi:hypothetical protein
LLPTDLNARSKNLAFLRSCHFGAANRPRPLRLLAPQTDFQSLSRFSASACEMGDRLGTGIAPTAPPRALRLPLLPAPDLTRRVRRHPADEKISRRIRFTNFTALSV